MNKRSLSIKEWMSMAPTAKAMPMYASATGRNTLWPDSQASMWKCCLSARYGTAQTCPSCHKTVQQCPFCQSDMRGMEEKGVDTRLTTAMISLAWIDNYDVALLVSSDRDFVPVVEFLETRGKKVVHGAFPPAAAELTRKCWGHIDVPSLKERFRRSTFS